MILASHYDSDKSIRVLTKKKARNGVLRKQQTVKPKNHSVQRYFVLFKKEGITEKIKFCIALKTILTSVPTISTSRMDWEEP